MYVCAHLYGASVGSCLIVVELQAGEAGIQARRTHTYCPQNSTITPACTTVYKCARGSPTLRRVGRHAIQSQCCLDVEAVKSHV